MPVTAPKCRICQHEHWGAAHVWSKGDVALIDEPAKRQAFGRKAPPKREPCAECAAKDGEIADLANKLQAALEQLSTIRQHPVSTKPANKQDGRPSETANKLTVSSPVSTLAPVSKAVSSSPANTSADRKAYQRELMRKRRAEAKAKKAAP